MVLKESFDKFKKDIIDQKCIKILENMCKLVMFIKEKKTLG